MNSLQDSVDSKNFNSEIDIIEETIRFGITESDERRLWMIEANNIRNLFSLLIEGKSRDKMMAQNFNTFQNIFSKK
jgi:hypothetical protein